MGLVCSGWVAASPSQPCAHMCWAAEHAQDLLGLLTEVVAYQAAAWFFQLLYTAVRQTKPWALPLLEMSWQPKAGEGCLARGSAGTRRAIAQARLCMMLLLRSQVEPADMSPCKEVVVSPWGQFSSQAERRLAVTEGTTTANCGSYYWEGVNALFGL